VRKEHPGICISLVFMALLLVSLGACAGVYFRDAGRPPTTQAGIDLKENPHQEYWTGIVFNGEKIGFSHFRLVAAADAPGGIDISSEAAFSFRFLMMDKKFTLKSYDRVRQDLSVQSFVYDYDIDGSTMQLRGELKDGTLRVRTISSGHEREEVFTVEGPVYPVSALYLYPALKGLEIGRRYDYPVYEGETRVVSRVHQEVLAYERSDLFEGEAFKVKTTLLGQEVVAWLDTQGRPLLEISDNGLIVSGIESEARSREYLLRSSMNKSDTLLDLSLIRTDRKIDSPRQVRKLSVALDGVDEDARIVSNERQEVSREGERLVCRVDADIDVPSRHGCEGGGVKPHLRSTIEVPADNGRIQALARQITQNAATPVERIQAVLSWIAANIEKESLDVFTALDVLDRRKAECQGHAVLYTALARASGIPTKVVNGIVYSGEHGGFLYHTWAESCVAGSWISVDPTFSQLRPDATHIVIVEGENPADLVSLTNWIGKVKAHVISAH